MAGSGLLLGNGEGELEQFEDAVRKVFGVQVDVGLLTASGQVD
jgi:hypothetical protein